MSKTETMSQEPFHFQMYQAPKRTKRIDKLYEYVGASKVGMCLERGKIITDVYMKNQSVPPIILRAIALKEILNKMSIYYREVFWLEIRHVSRIMHHFFLNMRWILLKKNLLMESHIFQMKDQPTELNTTVPICQS